MLNTTKYFIVVFLTLILSQNQSYAQYNGGIADGANTNLLTLTSCSNPPEFYVYFGGSADGASIDQLNLTTCANPPQFFA